MKKREKNEFRKNEPIKKVEQDFISRPTMLFLGSNKGEKGIVRLKGSIFYKKKNKPIKI